MVVERYENPKYRLKDQGYKAPDPKSKRPEKESESCFVATAVYRGADTQEVDLYRWLKDNKLAPSKIGQRFTDWYYAGGGESLARVVKRHPTLRRPIKAVLDLGALAIRHLKERERRST